MTLVVKRHWMGCRHNLLTNQ